MPSFPSLHHTLSIIFLPIQEKRRKNSFSGKQKKQKIREEAAPSTSPEAYLLPLHLFLHLWNPP